MKKLLSVAVVLMFVFSAAGWSFDVKNSNKLSPKQNLTSSASTINNIGSPLSFTSSTAQTSLNAYKPKKAKAKAKLIHKSTSVTKKTVHKKGNKTTTTTTTTTTKH
jgi:hypothetical protein